jgi:penicillin-binding protein 2
MILILLTMFLILAARLVYLQIIRGEYYSALAARNRIRSVAVPAPRGVVRDRFGEVIADNEPAFSVAVIHSEFDTANTWALAELLSMTRQEMEERLDAARQMPYRAIVVREDLDLISVAPVADNSYRLPGVIVSVTPRRRYRMGSSFCHLMGYVSLADSAARYQGELTGVTGLERILNDRLMGTPGFIREVVDAHGRVVDTFGDSPESRPVPGEDISLTIDAGLQVFADSVLLATGHPGAAVILDWSTGELLCLSSVPGFDPNLFIGGITAQNWNAILANPQKPLLNRAWSTAYPPASTFKIVTAAWLLEEGIVTAGFMPDPCYGSVSYGGNTFRCWGIHGRLNLEGALTVSCDSYFYRTAQNGNMDDLARIARSFGLGARLTSVLPGEAAGVVPDRALMNGLYGEGGWGHGNLLNLAIGQGELLTTPLQMAVVSGTVASRGDMPGLSLVIGDEPCGEELDPLVSVETLDEIDRGLRSAVTRRNGTLHMAMGANPIPIRAKSGTAETHTGEDHAWVCGYVPRPAPVAYAVFVEHAGSGGAVAGPLAMAIVEKTIERLYPDAQW